MLDARGIESDAAAAEGVLVMGGTGAIVVGGVAGDGDTGALRNGGEGDGGRGVTGDGGLGGVDPSNAFTAEIDIPPIPESTCETANAITCGNF